MPALDTRPDLRANLTLPWSAFWALHRDRHLGFGYPGAIPFTAIDAFARRADITDPDEFDRLRSLIGVLDRTFRTWLAEKNPPENDT